MKGVILGVSNIVELFVRIYVIYLITKYLDIESYGYFSYTITLGMLISIVVMYGIGPTLLQYYDKNKKLYTILIQLSFFNCLIVFPILYLFDNNIGILSVFNYLITVLMYINNSQGKVYHYATIKLTTYSLILLIIILNAIASIEDIINIYLYASVYLLVIYLYQIRLFLKESFNYKELGNTSKYMKGIFFSQIAGRGLLYIEKLIASIILDAYNFGVFALIKDIVNAIVYVFYYPIYAIYYKILLNLKDVDFIIKIKKLFWYFTLLLFVSLFSLFNSKMILSFFVIPANILDILNDKYLMIMLLVYTYIIIIQKSIMTLYDLKHKPDLNIYLNLIIILLLCVIYIVSLFVFMELHQFILYIIISVGLATYLYIVYFMKKLLVNYE